MSFEIFVTPFRDGEPAGFDRSLIEDIFGSGIGEAGGEITDISYPDGQRVEIFGADEPVIEGGVVFSRPLGDRIFAGIWTLADRTGALIYWPDLGPTCAVTKAETLSHVPEDLLADLGPAEIVGSGEELGAYIARQQ